MSVGTLFGFDEVLQGIVQAYPEVRLHVARSGEQTIVTAASSEVVAAAIGAIGASPGPVIREALVDLRNRLVARDEAILSASAAATTQGLLSREREIEARLDEISDALDPNFCESLTYQLESLLSDLTEDDLSDEDLESLFSRIRTAKSSVRELTAECEALQLELEELRSNDDDDDEDDYGCS